MQETWVEFIQDRTVLRNATGSLILIASVLGFRYVAIRFVRQRLPARDKLQLRWAAQVRGFSYVVLAFGLFIIWAAELQALAVSFVVFAMAIVWATKETLACVQGGMYRISSKSFEVGDRINIAGIRGDVIDPGLLGTLVLEVAQGHQRTGRTISIPKQPVHDGARAQREPRRRVHAAPDDDPGGPRRRPRRDRAQGPSRAAQGRVRRLPPRRPSSHRRPLPPPRACIPPIVDPRVTYQVVDKNTVNILLRIPTPIRLERQVEQLVLRAVLGVPKGRDTPTPRPPK